MQEAAAATGWSARMLRYVEQRGLVAPQRSRAGYRLYGPQELDRLRSLRALLDETGLELGEVAVALRLRRDDELRSVVDRWLDDVPPVARGALDAHEALEALRWEQDKHARLLPFTQPSRNTVKDAPAGADGSDEPASPSSAPATAGSAGPPTPSTSSTPATDPLREPA